MYEKKREIKNYPRYYFMDFFVVLASEDSTSVNDKIVILSNDQTLGQYKYYMHYFDLRSDLITWREKVKVNINGYQLRDSDPLIDFDQGNYAVFIDKSERNLFFVGKTGETEGVITTNYKVKNLDVC